MATLTVFNRAEEIVADGLSFTDFKRRFGRGSALIITLDCGEEILVDSCRLFRKLPPKAHYSAKLLKRATRVPDGLDAEYHKVWTPV